MNVLEGLIPSVPATDRLAPSGEGSSVTAGGYRVRFARAGVTGLDPPVIHTLIPARD